MTKDQTKTINSSESEKKSIQ